MTRFAVFLLSLAGSFTLLGTAASAQTAGYYHVTLAAEASGKSVVRDMVFNCDGAACTAAQGTSRPAIVCAGVARQLGPVTSFTAGGAALDGAALAKCNAKADTTKLARR